MKRREGMEILQTIFEEKLGSISQTNLFDLISQMKWNQNLKNNPNSEKTLLFFFPLNNQRDWKYLKNYKKIVYLDPYSF